jgi:hypothetical protein
MAAVEGVGAKVLNAYVTLGTFDVVSIVDAKDDAQVEAVDRALHVLGYYVAIERASAVPLDEFVSLSETAPVFVTAWLQGRRALDVDRSGRLLNEPPKAASPSRTRTKGVDERKVKRSPGASVMLVWFGTEGPLTVRDYAIAATGDSLTLSVALPKDSSAAASLRDLEKNGPMPGVVLAFLTSKTKLPVEATLVRMDTTKSGFDVVLRAALPKGAAEKLGLVNKR